MCTKAARPEAAEKRVMTLEQTTKWGKLVEIY